MGWLFMICDGMALGSIPTINAFGAVLDLATSHPRHG